MSRRSRETGKPTQPRSLYITELEDKLYGEITEELFVQMAKTFVLYYQIDETRTNTNVYGEGQTTIFKNPIQIYCFVEMEEPEVKITKYGMRQDQKITCWMHKRRLEELEVIIHEGDYVEWNGLTYIIVSSIDSRYLQGVPSFRDTIKVTCVIPDSGPNFNT